MRADGRLIVHVVGDPDVTPGNDEIERLRNRLERERRARRQAEIIAERGMRELWEANDELQRRVTNRTTELLRALGALERQQVARSIAIDRAIDSLADQLGAALGESGHDARETLGYIRTLLATAPEMATPAVSVEGDLPSFADALLARWQRPAARAGKLLSVELGDDTGPAAVDWTVLQALSDTLLRGCVRHETPGGLRVMLSVADEGASVAVSSGGPTLVPELVEAALASPAAWPAVGPGCEELAVAHAIVEAAGGSMRIECAEGTTSVSVVVPMAPVGSIDPADPV
jgi:hypothetical protein